MSGVDDLFSGEQRAAGPPVADRVPRLRRWIMVAAVLDVLGPACFTGVPGAAITIWCWNACDEELQRVESGVAPAAAGPALRRLKGAAFALLVFSLVSLAAQIVLFSWGAYDLAWDVLMTLLQGAPPS